jgi:hypothetical protein
MKRAARFIQYWFFTRSFSSAVLLDQFDNFKPPHGK